MMDEKKYAKLEQGITPKPPVLKNVIKAFIVRRHDLSNRPGIALFYMTFFDFTERTANNPTVATIIFIAMLLRVLGYIKKSDRLVEQVQPFRLLDSVMLSYQQRLNIGQKVMSLESVEISLNWQAPLLCLVFFQPFL